MGKHSSDSYGSDPSATGTTAYGTAAYPGGSASTGAVSAPVRLGENSESVDIVQQARARDDGFLYGDDRAIVDPPNWAAQRSTELYHGATANNVPSTAESTSQAWIQHSRDLTQAADDLYNAIAELGAAWVGQGSGAAQGALVAIANSSAQASSAADTMGNRLAQQAAAAAEVKKMPAPQEFDPGQELSAMLAGGPAALTPDMKAKYDQANSVLAQQIEYMKAYTQAMSEVDSSTPSFGPESLGLKPLAAAADPGAGAVGTVGTFGAPGHAVTAGYTGPVLGGAPGGAGSAAAASAVSGTVGHSVAGHVDTTEAAAHAGGQAVPGTGMGPGVSAGSAAPSAPQAPSGPGVGHQLGGAAVGGALGYAGGRALAKGNKSGTKQQSSETAAAANSAGSSAASVAPPQPSGMVSSSGMIGGSTPPPATGAPMGMGAGAGQQKEDEEHTHASFLIEPDPDDAFGANEATPPPVIGAWGPDEDDR
jgi:hypothetical protein